MPRFAETTLGQGDPARKEFQAARRTSGPAERATPFRGGSIAACDQGAKSARSGWCGTADAGVVWSPVLAGPIAAATGDTGLTFGQAGRRLGVAATQPLQFWSRPRDSKRKRIGAPSIPDGRAPARPTSRRDLLRSDPARVRLTESDRKDVVKWGVPISGDAVRRSGWHKRCGGCRRGGMVPRGGIEPPTLRFSVACSTN